MLRLRAQAVQPCQHEGQIVKRVDNNVLFRYVCPSFMLSSPRYVAVPSRHPPLLSRTRGTFDLNTGVPLCTCMIDVGGGKSWLVRVTVQTSRTILYHYCMMKCTPRMVIGLEREIPLLSLIHLVIASLSLSLCVLHAYLEDRT